MADAVDRFAGATGGVTGAITGALVVVPNDDNDLAFVTRALYLGATGDVTVILQDRTQVQFLNLAAGVVHPLRVSRVLDTGTDADLSILALY